MVNDPGSRGFALRVFAIPLALGASLWNCQYLPKEFGDQADTGGWNASRQARVQVLVSAADRQAPGTVLPVTIVAEWEGAQAGTIACVSVRGYPGTVEFPLSPSCADAATAWQAPAGDAAPGGAGAGMGSATAVHCVAFSGTAPDGRMSGTAIAAYVPKGSEGAATLFAALYPTPDCTGPELAETASVETLVPADDGGGSSDAATEAPADGNPEEASGDDGGGNEGGDDAAKDGGGE